MAAPPARARAGYDYLMKLLLIGDIGRWFICRSIATIGIDFKIQTIELVDGKRIKLQIWDTAGEERFRNIETDIRNWIRNIEQHASHNGNKILVGNKADMVGRERVSPSLPLSLSLFYPSHAVPKARGQALADEYGIKFFEASAKTNLNFDEVFFPIGKDIEQRLADRDARAKAKTIRINQVGLGHLKLLRNQHVAFRR
ncbi:hypothetical protein Bca4012_021312 [Brassica carinata]